MINFFIKTYGCQANVADSQAISNFLTNLGCKKVEIEQQADLILINTCAIRAKAEQRFFSYLGVLAIIKKDKKHLKVGIIGCVASYRQKEIRRRFDHVNFVFGAKENLFELQTLLSDFVLKIQMLKQFVSDQIQNSLVSFDKRPPSLKLLRTRRTSGEKLPNAVRGEPVEPYEQSKSLLLGGFKNNKKEFKQSYVNIMTGCNNYCSYCIVPFTRGREKSYLLNLILERVKRDVQNGAKEVVLLGQNVNSYKDPQTGANFATLLKKVAQVDGEFWVRFVSPHPKDMTKDVLYVMSENKEKLCGFIHHPLQSGSNKILQAMNRTYTVEQYLEQIDWIREILPDATISTDIIVGFPGETEKDYFETRKVMEKVKFDNIFSFIYSPRKYTKAATFKDDCSAKIKSERLEALQSRQVEICYDLNNCHVDKILKSLVEKRLANGKLLARTAGNHRVLFDSDEEKNGNFVNLKIEKSGAVNIFGYLIE